MVYSITRMFIIPSWLLTIPKLDKLLSSSSKIYDDNNIVEQTFRVVKRMIYGRVFPRAKSNNSRILSVFSFLKNYN